MTTYSLGSNTFLTTDHPASRDSIPVLCIGDNAYNPSDDTNTPNLRELFGPEPYPAAKPVAWWAFDLISDRSPLTLSERLERLAAADLYLRQWPDGPQAPALYCQRCHLGAEGREFVVDDSGLLVLADCA